MDLFSVEPQVGSQLGSLVPEDLGGSGVIVAPWLTDVGKVAVRAANSKVEDEVEVLVERAALLGLLLQGFVAGAMAPFVCFTAGIRLMKGCLKRTLSTRRARLSRHVQMPSSSHSRPKVWKSSFPKLSPKRGAGARMRPLICARVISPMERTPHGVAELIRPRLGQLPLPSKMSISPLLGHSP